MRHGPVLDADERPAALPAWRWAQHWTDVLFLHWSLPAAAVRVPAPLDVDTFDGRAWVSLVMFRLRLRPRGGPFLPGVSDLVEVNLRTYVRCRGQTGVWFLSIHADNRWAVRLARLFTPLPYAHAPLCYRRRGAEFEFGTLPGAARELTVSCRPTGGPADPLLDEWLVERYRAFAPGRGGLVAARVDHPRWAVEGVEATVGANDLGRAWGLDLSGAPARAHYSPGVRARFGAFAPVESDEPGAPNAKPRAEARGRRVVPG